VPRGLVRRPSGPVFWQWVRHHLASIAATVVDYSVMVTLVEVAHFRPVPATALGALAGGLANFTLNRIYTYRVTDASVGDQGWRYALVSASSLGWNTLGEHVFANVFGLQYILARLITSFTVSNVWNYPLQRFFVFSRRPRPRKAEARPHP